jgi:hypothetical protein
MTDARRRLIAAITDRSAKHGAIDPRTVFRICRKRAAASAARQRDLDTLSESCGTRDEQIGRAPCVISLNLKSTRRASES